MRLSALSCQSLGLGCILTPRRTFGGVDGRQPAQFKLSATLTAAAVITVLLALCASRAHAVDFDFVLIADENTPIPSGSGNFINFSSPSLSGGNVAFQAIGSSQEGIYADIGGLNAVADKNTPIPVGSGNFVFFDRPSLGGGNVAFKGRGSGESGIYTDIGALNVVADENTPIPVGSGNFTGFGNTPSLADGNVAFAGFGIGQEGIYTDIGGLNVVADLNTPIPVGSGNFTSFISLSLDGGNVAFRGLGSGQQGIYTDFGGLNVVTDLNTLIPVGSGNFTGFGSPSLDGGNVAFEGVGTGQEGIYTDIGGLNVVADLNTVIPGGSGNFIAFGSPSLDGGNVAFTAVGSGQEGIYTDFGGIGGINVVADLNTPIPGGSGNFTSLFSPSFDGGNVAFRGTGSGGQSGIYVALQEHHWDSGASGLWDDANNWRFAAIPRQVVPSFIDPNNGVVVTGPVSPVHLRALSIGTQQTGVAELQLQPSGHMSVEKLVFIQPSGELHIGGTLVALLGLFNQGTLGGSGQVDATLTNNQNAEVRVGSGEALRFTGLGPHANMGKIEVIGGEVEFTADLTNGVSPSLITGRNAILRFTGGLANDGSLALSFGTSDVFGDVTNSATGVIAVAGNSQATFYDDVANGGVLNVATGSTAVVLGALTGSGNVGGGDVQALGILAPAASPGLMDFGGDLLLGPLSTLEAEIGGTVPGSQFDQVNVAGNVALGGTLDVSLIDLGGGIFTPTAGDTFEIITAASILGTFATETLPALAGGLEWFVNYSGTSVELISTFAGDFNLDGEVDGFDFLAWQRGASPNPLSASDLADWEANYGTVAPLAASSAAVPEPSSAVLLIALATVSILTRRRGCAI